MMGHNEGTTRYELKKKRKRNTNIIDFEFYSLVTREFSDPKKVFFLFKKGW